MRQLAAYLFAFTFSFTVCADSTSFQRIPDEIVSPWTTAARPWLLFGTAMTLGFLAVEDSGDSTQQEMAEDKPLGDFSIVGDYAGQLIPNVLYIGGMYTAYWFSNEEKHKKHGLIMLKASLYSCGVSTLFKAFVKERRPNKGDDWNSFPSGHTTTAFAFASVVVAEHGIWPYGALAMSLATLTGLSRMNDNMHHGHDVVAGATIGTVFGLGVSYVNEAFDRKELPVAVVPEIKNGFAGLQVLMPFD